MSERDLDVKASDLSEEELLALAKKKAEERATKKAKLVSVYERGMVGDRLNVPLPPDLYGEWVPRDKMEVFRMQSLGFDIDREYAPKRALHDSGTGESIVADCVFMTCPMEVKEIIDEIKREQYEAANSPRGGKQREEIQFEGDTRAVGLPSQVKSRVDSPDVERIRAALSSTD